MIFPRAKKEGLCGEIISILKKDIKGVEIRDGIKGAAENRLVEKMILHYNVGRNVWFYFSKKTIMGAFAILHICI